MRKSKKQKEDAKRYQREKEQRKEKRMLTRETVADRLHAFKVACILHKGCACMGKDCNVVYDGLNAAKFHFHHRDPSTKQYDVSAMYGQPIETVLAELDKCDILCRNCHTSEHSAEY